MNEDLKNYCKCEIENMTTDFYFRNDTLKYRNECMHCQSSRNKEWSYNNYDKFKIYKKQYFQQNKNKINESPKQPEKNRKDSELNFKLACNLRFRTYKAFKSQNVRKTNKTFDLLGCSHSFFQNWINHQLYGNMTIEKYGSVWQIDHCLPIASFNLLDENAMKKCFNWINLRPMYSNENNSKNDKIDHYLYLCQ